MEADKNFRGEQEPSQGYWPSGNSSGESTSTVPRQARTMDSNIAFQNRHDPDMEWNPKKLLRVGGPADSGQPVVSSPQGHNKRSPKQRGFLAPGDELERPIQPGTQVPVYPMGLRRREDGSTPGNSGRPSGAPSESVRSTSGTQAPGRTQETLSTSSIRPKRVSDQSNIVVTERKPKDSPERTNFNQGAVRKPIPTPRQFEGRNTGGQIGIPLLRTLPNTTDRIPHAAGPTQSNQGLRFASVEEDKRVSNEKPALPKLDPVLEISGGKPRGIANPLEGIISRATPGQTPRAHPNISTSRAHGTISSGGFSLPNIPPILVAGRGRGRKKPQSPSEMPHLGHRDQRVDVSRSTDPRVSTSAASRDPISQTMPGIGTQRAVEAPEARSPGGMPIQTPGAPQRLRGQGSDRPIMSRQLPQRSPVQYPTNSTMDRDATTNAGRARPGISRSQVSTSSTQSKPAHSMQQNDSLTMSASHPQRNTQLNAFQDHGSPNQTRQRPVPAMPGTQSIEKHGPNSSLGSRREMNIGGSAKSAKGSTTMGKVHPVALPPQRPVHQPTTRGQIHPAAFPPRHPTQQSTQHNEHHPADSQKHAAPHSLKHSGSHHGKSLHESPLHHPSEYRRSKSPERSEGRPDKLKHPNSQPEEPHIESHKDFEESELKHPEEPLFQHTKSSVARAETPSDLSDTPGLVDPTDTSRSEVPNLHDSWNDHGERGINFHRHYLDPLYPSEDYNRERGHDTNYENFGTKSDYDDELFSIDRPRVENKAAGSISSDFGSENRYPQSADERGSGNGEQPSIDYRYDGNEAADSQASDSDNPLFPEEHERENNPHDGRLFDNDYGPSLQSNADDQFGWPYEGVESTLNETHHEDSTDFNEDSNSQPELHNSGGFLEENPEELFYGPTFGTHHGETSAGIGHDWQPRHVQDSFNDDEDNDNYPENKHYGDAGDPGNVFRGLKYSDSFLESDAESEHSSRSGRFRCQGRENETGSESWNPHSAGESDLGYSDKNEDESPYSDTENQPESGMRDLKLRSDQDIDELFADNDSEGEVHGSVSETQEIYNHLDESDDDKSQLSEGDEEVESDRGGNELPSESEVRETLAHDDWNREQGYEESVQDDRSGNTMGDIEGEIMNAEDEYEESLAPEASEDGMEGARDYDEGPVEEYSDY